MNYGRLPDQLAGKGDAARLLQALLSEGHNRVVLERDPLVNVERSGRQATAGTLMTL